MSSLLKDIYSKEFYNNFGSILAQVLPGFNKSEFSKLIFNKSWQQKELKERMTHTSFVLSTFLSDNFEHSSIQIEKIIALLKQKGIKESSIEFMFLPDYIEKYGINNFDSAVRIIEIVTQFTSCEYAVRPFISRYGNKMMKKMYQWSLHKNHHVRRLASEGSRPRLPWSIALPQFKNDPGPVFPILENLKCDPSEYVRRSVANNLNDISKDNPDVVISIAQKWNGISSETDAIIKHGCRTLLKQGNPEILKHYGLNDNPKIKITDFKILTPKVSIGESLKFSFSLHNTSKQTQTARIEYGLYYLKQNGLLSKKVFKISERQLKPNERSVILRLQSFKLITTRKFYTGLHELSVIINGREKAFDKFRLVD